MAEAAAAAGVLAHAMACRRCENTSKRGGGRMHRGDNATPLPDRVVRTDTPRKLSADTDEDRGNDFYELADADRTSRRTDGAYRSSLAAAGRSSAFLHCIPRAEGIAAQQRLG